ncbi:MAG: hypothetical protein R3C20_21555 [Planctomycetaceae bacterium]
MNTIFRNTTRHSVNVRDGEGVLMAAKGKPMAPDPDATLRSIMEGTAGASGEHFFRSLVQYLAVSLNVKSSFVAEFNPERTQVQTLAVWVDGEHVPNFDFGIEGTPCKHVLSGAIQHFADDVQQLFPPTTISVR